MTLIREKLLFLKEKLVELNNQLSELDREVKNTQKIFEEENPLSDLQYWDWSSWEWKNSNGLPKIVDSPIICNYVDPFSGEECGNTNILYRFKEAARCQVHLDTIEPHPMGFVYIGRYSNSSIKQKFIE